MLRVWWAQTTDYDLGDEADGKHWSDLPILNEEEEVGLQDKERLCRKCAGLEDAK